MKNSYSRGHPHMDCKYRLLLSAILLITFAVYLPSLQNEFVNWDDDAFIYQNPHIVNIVTWGDVYDSIPGIFSTQVMGGYTPLTILTFAFEKMFYGLGRPQLWHLDSIILHLISVALVFKISLSLNLKVIPAVFCAILFGIHPMRVESVAWLSERKDVLFGLFYLLALYNYIKSLTKPSKMLYIAIIYISFCLALISKNQAVTLPLSMILVDYYFDRKLTLKIIYEKWAYFLLSLIVGVVAVYCQYIIGALEVNVHTNLMEKMFIGSYIYIFYMIKSVFPYKMLPIYVYSGLNSLYYVTGVLAFSAIGIICYLFRQKKRELSFGLSFFTVNVMFQLQILSAGTGYLADRYTYIAYFGLFFIYAFCIQWFLTNFTVANKFIYISLFTILIIFGWMNYRQNTIWKNGETLWSYTINYYKYKEYPFPWEQRGFYYRDTNQLIKSARDFTQAIRYSEGGRKGRNLVDRGVVYARLNLYNKALQDFNAAERLDPVNELIYYNRSIIYSDLQMIEKMNKDVEKYQLLSGNKK